MPATAPSYPIKLIPRACKVEACESSCGCRKIAVLWSPLCSKCSGLSCHNAVAILLDLSTLNEDEFYVDNILCNIVNRMPTLQIDDILFSIAFKPIIWNLSQNRQFKCESKITNPKIQFK